MKLDEKSNEIDINAEVENANKAIEDIISTGTTKRRCLRCGGNLQYKDYGSGWIVKCETDNCSKFSFRGI